MKPLKATRDNSVSKHSKHFFSSIVYELSKDKDKQLLRHIIEKSTQKNLKKIAELLERDHERDEGYFKVIRSRGERRNTLH